MSEFEPIDEPTQSSGRNPWSPLWPALIFIAVLVAGIAMLDHEHKPDPKTTPLRPVTIETAGTNTIDGPRCIEFGSIDTCTTPAQCVEQGDGFANCVDQPGQHWLRCNAGLEVTDMRYCPEYKASETYYDYNIQRWIVPDGGHTMVCSNGVRVAEAMDCAPPGTHPQIHALVSSTGLTLVPVCPGDTSNTKRSHRNLYPGDPSDTLLLIANTINEMGERVCE